MDNRLKHGMNGPIGEPLRCNVRLSLAVFCRRLGRGLAGVLVAGSHLVMEVGRGGSQDAAVSFEHVTLDVDGEVTELPFHSLSVQAVQDRGLGPGEAHLHHRARRVAGGAAAASHLHGQRLHLGEETVRHGLEDGAKQIFRFTINDVWSHKSWGEKVHFGALAEKQQGGIFGEITGPIRSPDMSDMMGCSEGEQPHSMAANSQLTS